MKGIAKIDLLIVAAFSVATIAITGFFYYTIHMAPKALPVDKENFQNLRKTITPKSISTGLPVKKILINLPSRTARLRFLELEISLFTFEENQKKDLEDKLPVLQDTIINVASKMQPEELNSISGKILLEERIKKQFHKKTNEKIISKIFYTKFVVQ